MKLTKAQRRKGFVDVDIEIDDRVYSYRIPEEHYDYIIEDIKEKAREEHQIFKTKRMKTND